MKLSRTIRNIRYNVLYLMLVTLTISSCRVVRNFEPNPPKAYPSSLITYYLPKTIVHLNIKGERLETSKYMLDASGKQQGDATNGGFQKTNPHIIYVVSEIDVATSAVADQTQRYFFRYQNNIFSDDDLKVKLSKEGLIESIKVETEDQTGDFVVKIGELVTEVTKLETVSSKITQENKISKIPIVYEAYFDPTIPGEIARVQAEIDAMFGNASIKLTFPVSRLGTLSTIPASPANRNTQPGIKYRPMIPMQLVVSSSEITKSKMIPVPGDQIINLDIRRAAFVKKVTEIKFDDGILKEFNVQKKAEAVGFIEIPINLAKAIVSIPAELIQLKIDTAGKEKELAESQKALAEAEQNLIEYLEELRAEDDPFN